MSSICSFVASFTFFLVFKLSIATELFPVMSKEYVVATFLAILEMAKNRELKITQDEAFDDIICEVI